ncbi:hypothetical protein L2E82_17643 [Cichorium intybus]|uniref:Uncharacterized protein n=1 Tax=Cichorium intybus TaxID=13427 RepID=A0ACB9F8S8_CICIN|nr:hypothetical protein L2E82_17643 [Cichorium intybus]
MQALVTTFFPLVLLLLLLVPNTWSLCPIVFALGDTSERNLLSSPHHFRYNLRTVEVVKVAGEETLEKAGKLRGMLEYQLQVAVDIISKFESQHEVLDGSYEDQDNANKHP